jgi:hypothetical protein
MCSGSVPQRESVVEHCHHPSRRAPSSSTTRAAALCTRTMTRNAAQSELYQEDLALGEQRGGSSAALRADDGHNSDADANAGAP